MYKKDIYKYMPLIINEAKRITVNDTYKIWGYEVPVQFIELHIGNEKDIKTKFPLGYSNAQIQNEHIGIAKMYLTYDKRIHIDSEFALMVLCHEVGHVIHTLKDYNGEILKYNSLFYIDMVQTERMAWYYGLQIYKALPIKINMKRWYTERRRLLNSYIRNRAKTKEVNEQNTQSQSNDKTKNIKIKYVYQFSWIHPTWQPNTY